MPAIVEVGSPDVSSPLVAVVIPVFNKALYLRQCLESVCAQSLENVEVLCVDDASTDGSLEIAQAFAASEKRVRVLRHDANLGAGCARNTGLAQARAPWVQFMDADDLLPAGALERLHACAIADGVPLVRGSLANFRGKESPWSEPWHRVTERHRFAPATDAAFGVPYFHVCYLFSRAFLNREGITYPRLRAGEDPVFLARALVKAPLISTVAEVTYLYRQVPRPAPTIERILDFIAHVRSVRDLFLASAFREHWAASSSDFYRRDVATLLAGAQLDVSQRALVDGELTRLWASS